MKILKCGDVTGTTCSFEAHGNSEEETINKLKDHAEKAHPDMLKNATEDEHKMMMDKMHEMMHDKE